MQNLTMDNRRVLEAQGFGIAKLTGFDDQSLPLFAHRNIGDKAIGDVVLSARVGNPNALDDGEATYLARKAFHGMFPWSPGKECKAREFVEIDISRQDGPATTGKPARGCRWCRSAPPGRPKARGATAIEESKRQKAD